MESTFNSKDLDKDPIKEFQKLFARVLKFSEHDPSAMTLATATPDGRPSARIVLYKGIIDQSFVFYTSYESDKGAALEINPQAALVFYWHPVYQQVRIEGSAEKTSREESEKYFHSRPRESQLAAVASAQSKVIGNRTDLLREFELVKKKFDGLEVECPTHWGGYKVIPRRMEFWFGHPFRLHDRVCYTREDKGDWKISFLNP